MNIKRMLILAAAAGMAANAWADCTVLKDGAEVEVAPSASSMRIDNGGVRTAFPGNTVVAGKWKITAPGINGIKAVKDAPGTDRKKLLLEAVDGTGTARSTLPFRFEDESASVCGDAPVATASGANATVPLLTPKQCALLAEAAPLPPKISDGRYVKRLIFNSRGAFCGVAPILRRNDYLLIGIALAPNESVDATAVFGNCAVEVPTPSIYSSGSLSDLALQNRVETVRSDPQVLWLAGQACDSDAPQVTITLGTGTQTKAIVHTLSQYKRFRASIHLGALYSELHDPKYALRDVAGVQTIANEAADDRGVEYVGTVVIHGIDQYVKRIFNRTDGNDPGKWPYKGRDLVNEKGGWDSVGLVISAGLEHPGDRFGLGLSYEIAHGINLVGIYEFVKTRQLDGVAVGDPFAGALETLPRKDVWDKKVSLGLTFDIAYLTNIFGKGSK